MKAFDGRTFTERLSFFAYNRLPVVRLFTADGELVDDFLTGDAGFLGGVYVGGQ